MKLFKPDPTRILVKEFAKAFSQVKGKAVEIHVLPGNSFLVVETRTPLKKGGGDRNTPIFVYEKRFCK